MAPNKEYIIVTIFSPFHFTNLVNIPRLLNIIKKLLSSHQERGLRLGKAASLLTQGCILHSIGGYTVKVKEYYREAIAISKEIGQRETQARGYFLLGRVLFQEGEYGKAEDYFKESLAISENIGGSIGHFHLFEALACVKCKEGKNKEAMSYLLTAIKKCEKMRGALRDNDHWKISFHG